MNTFALFVAMLAPAIFLTAAFAQTQLPPPPSSALLGLFKIPADTPS